MSTAVQDTLAASATLEGTSLHTGEKLTLKPAPEGHDFKFRRIDLSDQPFINAGDARLFNGGTELSLVV